MKKKSRFFIDLYIVLYYIIQIKMNGWDGFVDESENYNAQDTI